MGVFHSPLGRAESGVPSPIRDIGYMARGLEPFREVFAVKITIWDVTAPLW